MKQGVVPVACIAEEQFIIQRIVKGELELYRSLMHRYTSVLYKMARCYGFHHQEAEVLMRATYLCAYKQLVGQETTPSFNILIVRTLVRKCVYKLSTGYFMQALNKGVYPECAPRTVVHRQKSCTPDESTYAAFCKALEVNLYWLPILYRTVFILSQVGGFSINDIAALMNASTMAVVNQLAKAKSMIRSRLTNAAFAGDVFSYALVDAELVAAEVIDKLQHLHTLRKN